MGDDFNPQPSQPEKKGSSVVKILLLVFGGLGLMAGCCCAGGFGLFYFGTSQLAAMVQQKFADNPVVEQSLGGIDSCSFNTSASVARQSEATPGEGNIQVFDVSGPKGSGQLILVVPPSGDLEQVEQGWLKVGPAEQPLFSAPLPGPPGAAG